MGNSAGQSEREVLPIKRIFIVVWAIHRVIAHMTMMQNSLKKSVGGDTRDNTMREIGTTDLWLAA